jgi:hypothetical protein
VCARVPVHVHVHVRLCIRVSVCARVCVRRRCAGTLVAGAAGTGGIYSSAATVGRPRVRFAFVSSVSSRALAAGVNWASRTTDGQWARRRSHTTVVDAAGAIYVIGGTDGGSLSNGITTWTYLRDVWKSTDVGARPD